MAAAQYLCLTILMISITRYLILTACLFGFQSLVAQGVSFSDTLVIPPKWTPEFRRSINHEAVDAEQRNIMNSDGKADKQFTPSASEEVNVLLTRSLTKKVDQIQYMIEKDTLLDHRLKVNYLKGLENMLRSFRVNWKQKGEKKVNPVRLPEILRAFELCVAKDRNGESVEPIIDALSYDAGTTILNAAIFNKNPGYYPGRNLLVLKYCMLHPDITFAVLHDNPDVPFADSLVRIMAPKYPRQLYDYAQANSKFGAMIRNIQDDIFIRSVSRMAKSKDGQQYFPFLDNIVKGRMTFADIDKVKDDSVLYYKLLVKTQIDYVERANNKDTAMEFHALTRKLEGKAKDIFVTTINGLHEEKDAVRFRCIQDLNAQELYYLAVLTDGLIYTSSYTKGVYPLMMKKINNRGDSLLVSLRFDHYRKFLSQAAAYNTLGSFLNSFPNPQDADDLMKAFVSRLERSDGLEDGVDVADSYASIVETLKPRADEMMRNVQASYQRNLAENNKRGVAIYNILYKLFLSADSTTKIDLTKELGVPPVYSVPFSSLANDSSGKVIAQVFFYGDKDGQGIFNGFQNMFSSVNWKIDRSNPQWITISSIKGKPVVIYANRALPEETGDDDKAQQALGEYLEKNNLHPSITIHRGHSYFANSTISYMAPSSRIVFMGSCGGFNLINDILAKTDDAHIIASKQIGKTSINRPFFELLTEKLRNGNNIDWIPFWKEFKARAGKEGFEDYIPPYKNLGAIFIKAYKKSMGDEDAEQKGF
jgi:hypothetical protein